MIKKVSKLTISVVITLILIACGENAQVSNECSNLKSEEINNHIENFDLDWFEKNNNCIKEKEKKLLTSHIIQKLESTPEEKIINKYKAYSILSILNPNDTSFKEKSEKYSLDIVKYNQGLYKLPIQADTKSTYWVLENNKIDNLNIIITKRIGSSGIGYSKRLIDCSNKKLKYLSSVNGSRGLFYAIDKINDHTNQDKNMYLASKGTVAYEIVSYVCDR